MSKPVIVLAALSLVSSVASAYFWQELKTERQAAQQLEQRIAQLELSASRPTPAPPPEPAPSSSTATEPPPPPPRAVESKLQAVASLQAVTRTGAVITSSRGMDPEAQRRYTEAREQQRRLLQNPEYRELMRSQHRLSMDRMYADLEPMLGLTKAESERLRELLAEQQLRRMEQDPVVMSTDGSPPDPDRVREYHRRNEEIQRKNESEIAALLGPKYSEWQTYQQSSWSRMQVMRLRENLAGSEEPLRTEQIKPLVEALAREQQQVQKNAMAETRPYNQLDQASRLRLHEEWLERTAQTNERIRNAASGFLSPAQLERLAQQQEQELKMQEVSLKLQRAQEEARGRGELPMTAPGMIGSSNAIVIAD